MSRYTMTHAGEDEEIVVGWDVGLQTYFAQVLSRGRATREDDERCLCWIGTRPAEIPTVDALQDRLTGWFPLTPALRIQLIQDQATQPPLTAHQRGVLAWLKAQEEERRDA